MRHAAGANSLTLVGARSFAGRSGFEARSKEFTPVRFSDRQAVGLFAQQPKGVRTDSVELALTRDMHFAPTRVKDLAPATAGSSPRQMSSAHGQVSEFAPQST